MELLHEIVVHKRFGEGKICAFNGTIMEVEFAQYGRRTFSYPTAFEAFLTLQNPELNAEIQADFSAALKLEAEKRLQRQAAIEKEREAFAEQHATSKKKRPSASKAPKAASTQAAKKA